MFGAGLIATAHAQKEPTKAAAAAPAPAAAQKLLLVNKAQAGQSKKMQSAGTFTVDAEGTKITVEFKQVEKVSFTALGKSGDLTYESKLESGEQSAFGQSSPIEESELKKVDTVTVHPDGTLATFASTDDDKDAVRRAARLYYAGQPLFSSKPVGVGETWTREVKGNDTIGTVDAKVTMTFQALEQRGDTLCARLAIDYAETTGKAPVSVKGTVWVEAATGDTVAADYELKNYPLDGDSTADGSIKTSRESGGPLPADVVAKANAALKPEGAPSAPPATTPEVAKKDEPKKEKTIDEVVKDFEKLPGVLTLYRKKEPGRETLYAEIREDQLNKLMLLQATAATGTSEQVVSGDPVGDLVFQFSKSPDEKLYLMVPNYAMKAQAGTPLARAVRRSFTDAFLQAFKIEAKQADRKSLLIDVSDFFKGDLMQVSQLFSGAPPIPGMAPTGFGMGLDREKTYVTAIKNFPENLSVTTQYAFGRGGGPALSATALADRRSAAILVNFNLSVLPENNGYIPRLYDPRVGYFTPDLLAGQAIRNFDQDNKEDLTIRYIMRWDLRKKDPAAAVSEPVQPIVFWIDNAVPNEYRDAVRDGLLVWNKAFEKVGFKNAIVVKQMPDDPDPKDVAAGTVPVDTADLRFNVIRWVVSADGAYAVAQARNNPITGQILNASITVDAGIVRYTKVERQELVEPAQAFARAALSPAEFAEEERLAAKARGEDVPPADAAKRSFRQRCELAGELRQQAWFGHMALSLLEAAPGAAISEEEFAKQFIRETVSHEFGHILGLRHNFVATTQFTLDQLANPQITAEGGIGASVMDYNPFNLSALRAKNVPFFSQTIGSYDYWAIEYGYTPVPRAKTPDDEKPELTQIARRSGQPGHAYLSDEAADSFDPLVTRFDLSSSPLDYWEQYMKASRTMLLKLDTRQPKNGESYYQFTRSFLILLGQYSRGAGQLSRYIGGQNLSRSHRGDIGEKPVAAPIDANQQKKALALINKYLFAPDGLVIPARYYSKLTVDPSEPNTPAEFPINDQLASLQRTALRRLFSYTTLARVASNEFKLGGDESKALTLPYLFRSVAYNIWAEPRAKANVPTLRRQLQRQHLDSLISMALTGGTPEDARMLAWSQLRALKPTLQTAAANPALDEYTKLHYADSLSKIDRTLTAQTTVGGGGGSSSLLQMLLGGKTAP